MDQITVQLAVLSNFGDFSPFLPASFVTSARLSPTLAALRSYPSRPVTPEEEMLRKRSRHMILAAAAGLCLAGSLSSTPGMAEAKFVITPVVDKKVDHLPPGPLYWQLDTFPSLEAAEAAAAATSLVADVEGKVWLFTLGPKDAAVTGGTKVTEIGPVTPPAASEYLLRINNAVAPGGTRTSVHTHAGSEAFYILSGQLSQQTPQGTATLDAGATMPGRGPDTPMQVSSTGTEDMHALVMFVVDAAKPFSTPAHLD